MFAQLDEMTDEPVTAEVVSGNRIHIAYGRSVSMSLDIGEAVDLVDATVTVLALLSDAPEKGVSQTHTPAGGTELFGDATENDLADLGSSELPDPPHGFDAVLPSEWMLHDGLLTRQWNLELDGGHVLCVEDLVNSEGEVTRAGLSINLVGLDDTEDPTALLDYMRTVEAAIDTFQRLRGL
ncbi:hypothetical protein [Rhodococcus sp. IEGM 1330]|uniref:hypothetical protein n=1 Tax=Rhodococcus sp. IEGM 1330 TaxID=3082225 RepID=UPI002953FFCF|nr:hypothetical protein [Rhodococcus sp. IEGM 1330]MDV8024006.1 hypothetical protein [Rhodococcus sp. IEGM 1330]